MGLYLELQLNRGIGKVLQTVAVCLDCDSQATRDQIRVLWTCLWSKCRHCMVSQKDLSGNSLGTIIYQATLRQSGCLQKL